MGKIRRPEQQPNNVDEKHKNTDFARLAGLMLAVRDSLLIALTQLLLR